MLFELTEDQYNRAISMLHVTYNNKIIMLTEFSKIKDVIDDLAFGIKNKAYEIYENSDDYVKHQLNKILNQVKKSS